MIFIIIIMYIVANMHTSYVIEYSSPVIHIRVANCTSSSEGFQLKMLWLLLSFTGKKMNTDFTVIITAGSFQTFDSH